MEESNKASGREPRDQGSWAQPVGKLRVGALPGEAINLNVEGRRLVGPLQGFGQLWRRTYRIRMAAPRTRMSGTPATPAHIIQTWRENFPRFWPRGNSFYAPLTRITPGEVAVLNMDAMPGMKLSTGIMVVFADDESFAFMSPEGHMFAAMITFSSFEEEGEVVAQVQALLRANDPVWELFSRLFIFQKEDAFWGSTLQSLADYFEAGGHIETSAVVIDPQRQWREAKNILQNAGMFSMFYSLLAPARWTRDRLRGQKRTTP